MWLQRSKATNEATSRQFLILFDHVRYSPFRILLIRWSDKQRVPDISLYGDDSSIRRCDLFDSLTSLAETYSNETTRRQFVILFDNVICSPFRIYLIDGLIANIDAYAGSISFAIFFSRYQSQHEMESPNLQQRGCLLLTQLQWLRQHLRYLRQLTASVLCRRLLQPYSLEGLIGAARNLIETSLSFIFPIESYASKTKTFWGIPKTLCFTAVPESLFPCNILRKMQRSWNCCSYASIICV